MTEEKDLGHQYYVTHLFGGTEAVLVGKQPFSSKQEAFNFAQDFTNGKGFDQNYDTLIVFSIENGKCSVEVLNAENQKT